MSVTEGRAARLREIQRTHLGGIDRIVLDQMSDEPLRRYAHISTGHASTTVHTTDDPAAPDPGYAALYDKRAGWSHDGVIDLDTGELVRDEIDDGRGVERAGGQEVYRA